MSASTEAEDAAARRAHEPENPVAAVDASAAMLRAESAHLDAMLRALVQRLESIPGLELEVGHRQGMLRRLLGDLPYVNEPHSGGAAIETLQLRVGEFSYTLRAGDGSILCARRHIAVDGAVGEREELAFAQWAAALLAEIERQNLTNHEALLALRDLVERGHVQ
jgi:hypothetical protein